MTIDFNKAFIGREKELEQLREQFRAASAGNGSFVVLAGEAGIGKSSLVRCFADEVRKEGGNFVSASFKSADRYHPFAPFLRVIDKARGVSAQPVYSVPEERLANGRETGGRRWKLQSLYSIQTEHGLTQQHLLSSILEVAGEETLVIDLHDLHLAPLTALQFLHYLGESLTEHKILLLATLCEASSVGRGSEAAYRDVLRRMNREGLVKRIEMARFGEKETRLLLNRLFHRSDFSSNLIPLLHEVTDGIPGRLRKCLERAWQQNLIYCQEGIWFDRENLEKETLLKLTNDIHDLKSSMETLAQIDEPVRNMLHYAALLEGKIEHHLLASIIGRPRLKVIKELHKLQEHDLLLCDSAGQYRFKYSAIGSVLLEQIPTEKRPGMHGEIAKAIEETDSLSATETVYQLAHHFAQARENGRAFHYLCRAIDHALANLAFVEALEFSNSALIIYANDPDRTPKSDVLQLLIQAAWLNRALGNWDESHRLCSWAEELCSDCEDEQTRTQIQIQQGLNFFRRNEWQKARTYLEKSLLGARRLGAFEQAIVYNGLGSLYFELADYDKSRRHLGDALKLAREADSKKLIANIINSLGAIENVRGNYMQAVGMYSQSIPLFESLGDRVGLARVYHNIGMTYADEKNWQEANEFYGKSLSVSDVMGLVPLKSMTFLNRAFAMAHLKRFDEAREYNIKAHRLVQRLKDDLGLAEYHKIQGVIEREESNWLAAGEHFQVAMDKFQAMENELGIAETSCEWARCAAATCDEQEMSKQLKNAIASYEKLGLTKKADLLRNEFLRDQPSPSLCGGPGVRA